MKLFTIFIFIFILLASFGCSRDPAETTCNSLRKMTDEINQQAPVKLDFVTTATGASAIYGGGVCTVTFSKTVNEQVFIDAILASQVGAHTKQRNSSGQRTAIVNWLNSSEGQTYFHSAFNQTLPEAARAMLRNPGIETYHLITFDQGNVKPLRIKVDVR